MSYIKSLGRKVRPIHKNVIVHIPQKRESQSAIEDPYDNNQIGLISDVSERCSPKLKELFESGFRHILLRKRNTERLRDACLDRAERLYIFPESEILAFFVSKGNRVVLRPFGRKILVRRIIESEKLASGIIIPYATQTKDQTLWAQVEEFGLTHKKDPFINKTLSVGDRVMLDPWNTNYIELGNMNGGYYLIVSEDNISYAEMMTDDEEPEILP